jgi:hypothetical protein
VTRCGICNFFIEMGTPELTPIICEGDYYILKFMPKGLKFTRAHTISDGYTCCDFKYDYIKAD